MKIFKPGKELRPYVRYYWIVECNEPFNILTFPIGCPQIIFHKRNPLYIPETAKLQSPITISGQVNFPAHVQSAESVEMIVAVFYPHTIGMFIDTPPSSFYNLEISGDDLNIDPLNQLSSEILDCDNHDKCLEMLENFLISRIKPSLNMRRINDSLYRMLHNPRLPIQRLADNACLCKRQFERVFTETVGMNPKEYASIVQFQKSLFLMQNGEVNYAGIAAECGFSDQSHFIRMFKRFTGHTPEAFLKSFSPYSDLFTNPT